MDETYEIEYNLLMIICRLAKQVKPSLPCLSTVLQKPICSEMHGGISSVV